MRLFVIDDETYLEAVKFKFKMNDYPIAIVTPELKYSFASDGYCRMMSLDPDIIETMTFSDLPKSFVDLDPIFSDQVRNVLLQRQTYSFLDILIVEDKKMVYYKKMSPLIAPSGFVLGVEVHLVSMAAVVGALHVLNRFSWYTPDDASVAAPLPESRVDLTSRQETYLFFVMQGFSNLEISSCLNVSKSTVENTIRTITTKFNKSLNSTITNRSSLKQVAFQLGYGFVLPRDMLKPRSIPLQYSLDDWMYLNNVK
ncbi:Regulatory LuxR family protein [Vibrio crassostreae]|nr:Regulatory LuxR family protein [Vibrio crassostreae]CAK3362894.1 Regulatory LuxR family protein [Vibrio crassostreae]CAK3761154.1 Regulatory LuxR family protein [Vibrio crassostreae]